MKKFWIILLIVFLAIIVLFVPSWGIWLLGQHFTWDWGGFWLNFFSNAGSDAVIGLVLYWIITRPDEKKAANRRRKQALAMLKFEFKTDLDRARQYGEALKHPENDLSPLFPLRFTRGAWNALRESGFLTQIDDVSFIYELLQVNEVITVANSSFSTVRRSKADNKKIKLGKYAKKAVNECTQIQAYLVPILSKLEAMKLPGIKMAEENAVVDIPNDDLPEENEDTD